MHFHRTKHAPPDSSVVILLDKMGWIRKRRESGKEKERYKIEGGGKEKEEGGGGEEGGG